MIGLLPEFIAVSSHTTVDPTVASVAEEILKRIVACCVSHRCCQHGASRVEQLDRHSYNIGFSRVIKTILIRIEPNGSADRSELFTEIDAVEAANRHRYTLKRNSITSPSCTR